jgi:dihydroxyacetone kinase-like protein
MKSTIGLIGKKGRSFHAGERGAGHQDPGATSCYLLLKSIYETVKSF